MQYLLLCHIRPINLRGGVPVLQGRRIAFVGWAESEATEYADALRGDGAACEQIERDATQACNSFDLVILRAGGTFVSPEGEGTLLKSCTRPVLVIGDEAALQRLAPALRQPRRSFAIEPCKASELQLRVSLLQGEAQSQKDATVVIADDDRVTRAMIEAWLVKAGFTCHAVGNGQDALELIRRLRPAAVILDLYMPRRNGFAVLQEIRNDPGLARTRVLMLTGSAEQDNVRRASALHADAYLVKPFQAAKLVDRIRALLDKAA